MALASDHAILTIAEMYRADAAAVRAGILGETLMENAGAAVARAVQLRWSQRPVLVLCGPGSNGGDGFVAARHLAEAGWSVTLALLGAVEALKGDAARHAARWNGPVSALSPDLLDSAALVIDALFGAGLSRPLDGMAREMVENLARSRLPVVAVDMPSGVHGDSGQVLGAAAPAALTVTFFRRKPGHLLFPGRRLCGEVAVADIGIPERVLVEIKPRLFENAPTLWHRRFPWPRAEGHKYDRGHAVVAGGAVMTGAARLAARAARRIGAGLVTIAVPAQALPIYAAGEPGAIVLPHAEPEAFGELLADRRRNAFLLGPGGGADDEMRARVVAALAARKAVVLDADALTAFSEYRNDLFWAIDGPCLMTPHEGEFARLFDAFADKVARARAAATESKAVVLLKGGDTVVAAPDGRAVINTNAPPELATAGSGDVLAGMAVGLMAQGLDAYGAGMIAAWLHGEAGREAGIGLIAEDLAEALPKVLTRLKSWQEAQPRGE